MKYSYATIALPTLNPSDAITEVAAAGFRGIEWKVGEAPHAMSSSASYFLSGNRATLDPENTDAADIRTRCTDAGLDIVGLGPYLDVGDFAGLAAVVSFAVELGAPQIRLQAPRTTPPDINYVVEYDRTVRFLEEAERLGRDTGVRTVLEMHHITIAPSASLAHSLVEQFDPSVIGVIYDVGNLVWEGYESHRIALQILGPYLHHVHLKNAAAERVTADPPRWAYTWTPLEDGLVDVAGFLDLLASLGYDGWISIEDLSRQRHPLDTLKHNAAILQNMPQARWFGAHSTTTSITP